MQILQLVVGIAIVVVTLRDVVASVVVPGSSQGWLKLAERLRVLTLPVWRRASVRRQSARRMSCTFAPFILVATLAGWTVLLVGGFGLLLYGLRDSFDPPLESFGDAIYAAGASIVTIGLGQTATSGAARYGVLAAGFSGLFVITLTVTYILSVQNALHQRDSRLVALTALPGAPCTGTAMLETYARLRSIDDLPDIFQRWAEWCAAVAYGHSAHPALAYFRSVSAEIDWPTAMGAMMDAAAIYLAVADTERGGTARILLATGEHAIDAIAKRFNLAPAEAQAISDADFRKIAARLGAAGYPLRTDDDALRRLTTTRLEYIRCVVAVAQHLGSAAPSLL